MQQQSLGSPIDGISEILMFKGQGVDEAISSVICDRDAFRSLLVCVRRVVKPRDLDVERRKRKVMARGSM